MHTELSNFAGRLLPLLRNEARPSPDEFNERALELFALQFKSNPAYQAFCIARRVTPGEVGHWTQIPFVPAAAFKEFELTSIPADKRTAVFHSSGTTEQRPSRHFHCAESLALYQVSLWSWFQQNIVSDFRFPISDFRLVCLTPPPLQAPHSSLVHMFEVVRQKAGGASVPASRSVFFGRLDADGAWALDFDAVLALLNAPLATRHPLLVLGTAFSFVHLLDFLAEKNLSFTLPAGSRVMETGGYKNRSHTMPKTELHALITRRLGVSPDNIICEYGMSELSSQAYQVQSSRFKVQGSERQFQFPPWSHVQIVSTETGREVVDGETGLVRVFDLANVFSVAAVQTEDLAVRRDNGFELLGRAPLAEPRGCSLMMLEGSASSLPDRFGH